MSDHIKRSVFRDLTAPFRVLPDFLIIGTQKGGTTRFYRYLIENPMILPAADKEIRFFHRDEIYKKGLLHYRKHFPLFFERYLPRLKYGNPILIGEATPSYIFKPKVPERVHKVMPHLKLIAMLRDPVKRAYSQFQMASRLEFDKSDNFETAVRNDKYNHYLARGRYAQQLERWFKFYPKESFLILQSEKVFADEQGALDRIYNFLGVKNFHQKFNDKKFPPAISKGYEKMSAKFEAKLRKQFKAENEKLYDLIGERYDWPD
ncbi:MAG: sulfotransferase domain-containing protein [Candidatus Dojkabacteria bacterium]